MRQHNVGLYGSAWTERKSITIWRQPNGMSLRALSVSEVSEAVLAFFTPSTGAGRRRGCCLSDGPNHHAGGAKMAAGIKLGRKLRRPCASHRPRRRCSARRVSGRRAGRAPRERRQHERVVVPSAFPCVDRVVAAAISQAPAPDRSAAPDGRGRRDGERGGLRGRLRERAAVHPRIRRLYGLPPARETALARSDAKAAA